MVSAADRIATGFLADYNTQMLSWLTNVVALVDPEPVQSAAEYIRGLSPEDKDVVMTWLVFEGITRGLYYILVFLAVFLLGRRIIQAVIAAYREARAEAA